MKSFTQLEEGLLAGQEETLKAGDEFDKIEKAKYKLICKELKKFLKICESSKNFKKWPSCSLWFSQDFATNIFLETIGKHNTNCEFGYPTRNIFIK